MAPLASDGSEAGETCPLPPAAPPVRMLSFSSPAIQNDDSHRPTPLSSLARRTTIATSQHNATIGGAVNGVYLPQLPYYGRVPDTIIGQTAAATIAAAAVSPVMTIIDLSM